MHTMTSSSNFMVSILTVGTVEWLRHRYTYPRSASRGRPPEIINVCVSTWLWIQSENSFARIIAWIALFVHLPLLISLCYFYYRYNFFRLKVQISIQSTFINWA
jgi:hypothetical protein